MPQQNQPQQPPQQFGAPPTPQASYGPPPGPPQGPPPGYGPPPGPPQGPPPGYGPPPGPPPGYGPPPGPPPGYGPPPQQAFGAPPPPGYPQAPPGFPAPYGQQQYGVMPFQQPGGLALAAPLAAPGKRFVAALLRIVLMIVTLLVGYLIWDLITWSKGQTPEYQIMKMRVVKKDTGQTATWGTMFVRGFLGFGIVQGLLNGFLIGYILLFMMFWDKDRQNIYDKMAGTVVLDISGMPA